MRGFDNCDPFDEISIIMPSELAYSYEAGKCASISGSPPVICNHSTPASPITSSSVIFSSQDNPWNRLRPR